MPAPYQDNTKSIKVLHKESATVTRAFSLPRPSSQGASAVTFDTEFVAGSGATPGVLDLEVQYLDPNGTWQTHADLPSSIAADDVSHEKFINRPLRAKATLTPTSGVGFPVAATHATALVLSAVPAHGETLELVDGLTLETVKVAFYRTAGDAGVADASQVDRDNIYYCPLTGTPGSTAGADIAATRTALVGVLGTVKTAGSFRITASNGGGDGDITLTHDVKGEVGNVTPPDSSDGTITGTALAAGTGVEVSVSLIVSTV